VIEIDAKEENFADVLSKMQALLFTVRFVD
jgi:hypothetical protein